jgi:glutamyl-tRNA synthetase
LTPVPAILSSESSQQSYAFRILAQETSRYASADDIPHLLPYLFWRPPIAIYRAALTTDTPRRDLINLVHDTVNSTESWEIAFDRLLERVPSDQAPDLHSILRLVAVGSPQAVAKASRILFSILGQDEWRVRATQVRDLLHELDSGGENLRQRWKDEAATTTSKADAVVG